MLSLNGSFTQALEKLNISMGKYVLGVNKRTTNLTIYGDI
jgi:hypothetical protein